MHEHQVELAERYADALRAIIELQDHVPTDEEFDRAESYRLTLVDIAERQAQLEE